MYIKKQRKRIKSQIIIALYLCISLICNAQVVHDNVLYWNYRDGLLCKGFADTTLVCRNLILPDSILVDGVNRPVYAVDFFAFLGRKDLHYVKLPNTLRRVFQNAFAECENLDSVYVGDSLRGYFPDVFNESNLIGIRVSPQNPYYDSRDDSQAVIDSKSNELIVGTARTVIPNSVIRLCEYAFHGRKRLKHITIPKSIKTIATMCFDSCDSLASVTFEDTSKYSENEALVIGNGAFGDCCSLANVKFPNRLRNIENAAFYGCKSFVNIYIPGNVHKIGMCSFSGCNNLKSITISPDNIYYDSRNNCNAIIDTKTNELISACSTTVIPSSVEEIGSFAFSTEDVDSIFVPDGVKEIHFDAFDSRKIRTISIPETIKEIAFRSFIRCPNLEKLYMGHLTPPDIYDNLKEKLKGNKFLRRLTIYVPQAAYKLFKKHPKWKRLRIVQN